MRKTFALIAAFALLASVASAQRRPPGPVTSPAFLGAQIDRMEETIRGKSAVVRRDAFIVSQLVAGMGELDDFQRSVAVDKARDHINDAYKRAGENPIAPRATFELLQSERDLIEKARQQGATADVAGLKAEMMKVSHPMQQVLFAELDDLRKDRQTLSDIQSRLSSMTNDMDSALAEALGSTFDYFKAGGK
jgi:hypothetical protein